MFKSPAGNINSYEKIDHQYLKITTGIMPDSYFIVRVCDLVLQYDYQFQRLVRRAFDR